MMKSLVISYELYKHGECIDKGNCIARGIGEYSDILVNTLDGLRDKHMYCAVYASSVSKLD